MSDKTIEQLQEEIVKLKDKNTQLLAEKRSAQAQRDEIAEKLAAVEQDHKATADRLEYLTVQLPREEVLEQVGMPNYGPSLWREITYHFEVVRNDDGQDMLHDKEGQPLLLDDKPVAFDVAGIRKLYESGTLPTIGAMIKGGGATGGGATGGKPTMQKTGQQEQKATQFGMR